MKALHISLSALKLSEYRKFKPKEWDRNRYRDLFERYTGDRNRYRIYLPLKNAKPSLKKVPVKIKQELDRLGYVVEDYRLGLVKPKNSNKKNLISLGKVIKSPDLLKEFVNDPNRQGAAKTDYLVVVSRHPYDLISMSTGRGWTSCQDLREHRVYAQYLKTEPEEGTLIAYLVKKIKGKGNQFDVNIEQPVARIKIYSYQVKTPDSNSDTNQNPNLNPANPDPNSSKFYLVPAKLYGSASGVPEFLATVKQFCNLANRRQKLTDLVELDPMRVYLDETSDGFPVPSSVVVIQDFNQVFEPGLSAKLKTGTNLTLQIDAKQRRLLLDHLLAFPDKINTACLFVLSRIKDNQFSRLPELVSILDDQQLRQVSEFGSSSAFLIKEMLKRELPLSDILEFVHFKIKDRSLIRELFDLVVASQEAHSFLVAVQRPLDKALLLEGLRSPKVGQREIAVDEILCYPKKVEALLDYANHDAKARIINRVKPDFKDLGLLLSHFNPANKQDLILIPEICRAYSKERALLGYLVKWVNQDRPASSTPILVRYLFYVADRHYVSTAAYDYVLENVTKIDLKLKIWLCLSFIIYVGLNDFIRSELAKILKSETAELELARALVLYCSNSRAFNAGLVGLLDELMAKKEGKAYAYLMKNLKKLSLD